MKFLQLHTAFAKIFLVTITFVEAAILRDNRSESVNNQISDFSNDETLAKSDIKTDMEFGEETERYAEMIKFEDPELLNNEMINKQRFTYLNNNENLCFDDVYVLAIIKSSPQNFLHRREIRDTWASVKEHKGHKIAYVFTIGQLACGNGSDCNSELKNEIIKYGDIIQADFIEHFKNESYKTIMGLTWAKTYCGHAKNILNTNDETMVDVFHLVELLDKMAQDKEGESLMYCSTFFDNGPSRNPNDKSYITIDEYPFDKFPPHCEGFANIMSNDVVTKLLEAAKSVAFLWLDNVFTTGFLPLKAGIKHNDMIDGHSYIFMQKSQIDNELQNAMFILANYRQLRNNWESTWNKIKTLRK